MFKELFTESRGRGGSRIKSSKPAPVSDIAKAIKNMNPKEVINIYEELQRGYLDDNAYDFLVIPGDMGYIEDSKNQSLIKRVLKNLEKAMDKVGIKTSVIDCAKEYMNDTEYIYEELSTIIQRKYKNTDMIYPKIATTDRTDDFMKKYNVVNEFVKALKKLSPSLVCDFYNAGIADVTLKKTGKGNTSLGRSSVFESSYEVTVKHNNTKELVKFNIKDIRVDSFEYVG